MEPVNNMIFHSPTSLTETLRYMFSRFPLMGIRTYNCSRLSVVSHTTAWFQPNTSYTKFTFLYREDRGTERSFRRDVLHNADRRIKGNATRPFFGALFRSLGFRVGRLIYWIKRVIDNQYVSGPPTFS